ncbi:MAG: membrane dipeptidase [Tannerella sp.]|jgi:microsomal dipeptidase-like Zn-dependent dipeptidase/gamma-glutamyl-gamma-aminobutyrate hydrolase PuuD|nr:membrane dipeptidase [Tannerella sp.]
MKPLIGISANHREDTSCLADAYVEAVRTSGGIPVIVPVMDKPGRFTTSEAQIADLVPLLDGLLLSGGGDLNPLLFGEEPIPKLGEVDNLHDRYEWELLRLALGRQVPVLGICRGHQLLQVALGGELYQDVQAQYPGALKHSQQMARDGLSHNVDILPDTRLAKAIGQTGKTSVNSFHHQAVKEVAPGFIASALSSDGLNEAAEHPEYPRLSVQWHPECLISVDKHMQGLFRAFIEEAARFARVKALHRDMFTVDLHTDAPRAFDGPFDLAERLGGKLNAPRTESLVNLPLMRDGLLDATFLAAFVPQGERNKAGYEQAWAYALDRLEQVQRQELLNAPQVGIARSADDLLRLKEEGRKAFFPCVENGYAIGKDLSKLQKLKELGVGYLTLCHNGANDICDSAVGPVEWGGLSPFGREVVHELNRLGILIDVSHASEQTFYDVLRESRQPIIATHSSARALCDHPRNLTDEQLKALAEKRGLVNVCLFGGFIRQGADGDGGGNSPATLSEAIRHIDHIVKLIGAEHVGIGSDFDGGGGLVGCHNTAELLNITRRLLENGYEETDIRNIWGGNLLRLLRKVQGQ